MGVKSMNSYHDDNRPWVKPGRVDQCIKPGDGNLEIT